MKNKWMVRHNQDDEGIAPSERRDVLKGLAAAGGIGLLGASGGTGVASASHAEVVTASDIEDHISLRQSAAQQSENALVNDRQRAPNNRNHDEQFETTAPASGDQTMLPWVYTRGLGESNAETPDTMVTKSDHQAVDGVLADLLAGGALTDDGSAPTESDIPHGHRRPLVSMTSAVSLTTEGTDAWMPQIPAAPDHNSGRAYVEMLEAYAMSLLRDRPFHEIDGSSQPIQALAADFQRISQNFDDVEDNNWEWFQGVDTDGTVNAKYLFRDPIYGCDRGPHGSQIWYHDVPIGGISATPKIDQITGIADWNGNAPALEHLATDGPPFCITDASFEEAMVTRSGAEPAHDPEYRVDLAREQTNWVHNGMDLASQVRDDPAYQPYLLAALEIAGEWGAPFNENLPYHRNNSKGRGVDAAHPYIDFGAVGLLDITARVCRNALISAWMQKWYAHRRLRPGTYARRIVEGGYDLDDAFLNSQVIDLVRDHNEARTTTRSAYLPQVFPEGAPAHPAYPSGHSVIAGACATVLKTFFENVSLSDLDVSPVRPEPGSSGGRLTEYTGGDDLTVHGEINKFASNIGLARVWAGVHYRSDHLYGMLLGQQVALTTMWDHFTNNSEPLANDHPGNNFPTTLPVDVYKFLPDEFTHPLSEPAPEAYDEYHLEKRRSSAMSYPV